MEIQVATLCDSAADYYGKLCVLGAFDTIVAPQMPAIHPQCAVALRVVFRKEEEGEHGISVRIIDEDGQHIVPPINARVNVQIPDGVFFLSRNAILNLQQLKFARHGLYAIEIAFDGEACASVPLQVRLMNRN
jgi:hypothetical protein